MIGRNRFRIENIQRRATQFSALQRGGQRGTVRKIAAADIDED